MVLTAEHLGIVSDERTVIDDCSFELATGDIGLVTGPSGSGKTALGLACCGLLGAFGDEAVLTGAVSLFGDQVVQGQLAPQTGVVLENPYAQVSGMKRTVAGELAFSLECRGVPTDEITHRTARMLDRLGLARVGDHALDTLSGGELARTIIGAVLITEPRFFVLDRPLTELDPSFRDTLIEVIRQHIASVNGAALIAEDPWLLGDSTFDREIAFDNPTGVSSPTEPLPIVLTTGTGRPALRVEHLTFSYEPDEPLIDDVSCTVEEGGVLFLAGPNGAGKSTVAKLVTGLLTPGNGRIFIGESDAASMTMDERIALVGYAPQQPGLVLCRRTVREELALAALWGNDPSPVVPYLGLDRVMDEHPLELPRAVQKRLGAALAYCNRRKVIILDEPSQYQDHAGFAMLVRAIDAITSQGIAVVIISHDPRFSQVFPDAPVTRLVRAGSG